ncbi:uncharacterized protein METZ01_LOCUS331174 [marine metagenome]|uniref:Uncharacterized protein n=1 Tax=marine metagenome TaxID=408172 RepID=A0A382PZY4_9ZZZZ
MTAPLSINPAKSFPAFSNLIGRETTITSSSLPVFGLNKSIPTVSKTKSSRSPA